MGKIFGFTIAAVFLAALSLQVGQVFAKQHPRNVPITSPITSPACKPGWGFGDKNHCHFGPPGLLKHTPNTHFSSKSQGKHS